jgi:hypothetical protein
MTWEEIDTLGALAGWQACIFCKHFVEPWGAALGGGEFYQLHAICFLVHDNRHNSVAQEWALKEFHEQQPLQEV